MVSHSPVAVTVKLPGPQINITCSPPAASGSLRQFTVMASAYSAYDKARTSFSRCTLPPSWTSAQMLRLTSPPRPTSLLALAIRTDPVAT